MTRLAKRIVILVAAVLLVGGGISAAVLFGSNHNDQAPVTPAAPEAESSGQSIQALNSLTGEPISAEAAGLKPTAIIVENAKQALPQWGLSSADIVYETLAEGGITRNLAMFADSSSIPKVGPVRSVREYFPALACPSDALFVHFGGSDTGYQAIQQCGLSDIDGLKTSSAFGQDPSRVSRGKEHSYYTSSSQLLPAVQANGIDMQQTNESAFLFGSTGYTDGQADSVSFAFSDYCPAEFVYDPASGKYLKSEFGQPQTDANNDQQIAVKNVMLLYADISNHPDGSGRQQIAFDQGGSGYYFSEGQYTKVRWNKQTDKENIHLMDMEGSAVNVHPGQTWVCILPQSAKQTTEILPAQTEAE